MKHFTSTNVERSLTKLPVLRWSFVFLFALLNGIQLQAQTCCTNEVLPNNSFETATTLDSKFPNATITTANNANSVTNYTQGNSTGVGGWYIGTGSNTQTDAFLILDATRASDGSQFWYLPRSSATNGTGTVCLSNASI